MFSCFENKNTALNLCLLAAYRERTESEWGWYRMRRRLRGNDPPTNHHPSSSSPGPPRDIMTVQRLRHSGGHIPPRLPKGNSFLFLVCPWQYRRFFFYGNYPFWGKISPSENFQQAPTLTVHVLTNRPGSLFQTASAADSLVHQVALSMLFMMSVVETHRLLCVSVFIVLLPSVWCKHFLQSDEMFCLC